MVTNFDQGQKAATLKTDERTQLQQKFISAIPGTNDFLSNVKLRLSSEIETRILFIEQPP